MRLGQTLLDRSVQIAEPDITVHVRAARRGYAGPGLRAVTALLGMRIA
jgi:hypothetical protein